MWVSHVARTEENKVHMGFRRGKEATWQTLTQKGA